MIAAPMGFAEGAGEVAREALSPPFHHAAKPSLFANSATPPCQFTMRPGALQGVPLVFVSHVDPVLRLPLRHVRRTPSAAAHAWIIS